ncbi:hypothetical protein ACHAWF_016379, partial [Thalassiosira exigua]
RLRRPRRPRANPTLDHGVRRSRRRSRPPSGPRPVRSAVTATVERAHPLVSTTGRERRRTEADERLGLLRGGRSSSPGTAASATAPAVGRGRRAVRLGPRPHPGRRPRPSAPADGQPGFRGRVGLRDARLGRRRRPDSRQRRERRRRRRRRRIFRSAAPAAAAAAAAAGDGARRNFRGQRRPR